VMSKRGSEGTLSAQRCYVRKPGPRSEEPFTTEEWRRLLERCLHARRESMLDAIRVIVQGHTNPLAAIEAGARLTEFSDAARSRWRALTEDLPEGDPGRMPHGRYELEFEIVGVQSAAGTVQLLDRMREASRTRHTGWGPFVQLTRPQLEPRPVDGNVEAWLGPIDVDRATRDAGHCDFWRASPAGLLFLMRGYEEDAEQRFRPGTIIDFTLPIWRVGEAMLYVARLAQQFDTGDPDILVRCHYYGLRGRRLDCLQPGRSLSTEYIPSDDEAALQTQATARQLDDNLVEVLHTLLSPLYERFSFFELPRDLVRMEIDQMRSHRF
jgi:hypothetical protein